MIGITPSISIDEAEIQLDFIRSSGPGGQNINKVATGVQLRFDVANSSSLPEDVKHRLMHIARNRITKEGILVIEAKHFRTQEQNREDALARLVALVYKATEKPKPRKKTKPSASANAARIESKKRRGALKRQRNFSPTDIE